MALILLQLLSIAYFPSMKVILALQAIIKLYRYLNIMLDRKLIQKSQCILRLLCFSNKGALFHHSNHSFLKNFFWEPQREFSKDFMRIFFHIVTYMA